MDWIDNKKVSSTAQVFFMAYQSLDGQSKHDFLEMIEDELFFQDLVKLDNESKVLNEEETKEFLDFLKKD